MRTFQVTLTVAARSIHDMIGGEADGCRSILLQAPIANASDINFGENGREFAYITNGGSAGIDVNSTRNVWVKGAATDSVIIVIF